jgi:ubiquinone biosynthesis protein
VIFLFSRAKGRLYRARLFRQLLEKLGVLFIKIGQILSTRIDIFSYEYQQELARLLDNSKTIPFSVINECVASELNSPIESVFDSFETEPLASASIGQVHKAVFKGQKVAVKVQRPGIQRQIESDFRFLNRIVKLIRLSWPQLWLGMSMKDVKNIVDDVAEMSLIELDYRKEADELNFFNENNFSPNAQFPKVFAEVSTSKILVTQFLEGIPFVDLMKRIQRDHRWFEENGYNKEKLAELLLETQLKQLFVLGHFQADSHPGNIILTGPESIGFVDFGIVGHLPQEFRTDMLEGILAEIAGDYNLAFEITIRYALPTYKTDVLRFKKEVFALMKSFREANYKRGVFKSKSLGVYLENLANLYRKHNLNLTPGFTAYMRSSIVYGNTFAFLFPDLNFFEVATPIYLRIQIEQARSDLKNLTTNDVLYGLLQIKLLFNKLTKQIRNSDIGFEVDMNNRNINSIRKILVNINVAVIAVLLLIGAKVFSDVAVFQIKFSTAASFIFLVLVIGSIFGILLNALKRKL